MKSALTLLFLSRALVYGFTIPLMRKYRGSATVVGDGPKHGFKLWSSSVGKTDPDATIYSNHIQNLSTLLEESSDMIQQMKRICFVIQDMELNHPSVTKLGSMSTRMAEALSEAKAADDVFGPNSVEANAAWDMAEMACIGNADRDSAKSSTAHQYARYEEAAVSSHHNYMTVVDLTTLRAAIDAFGKIEHLYRLVKMESKRIGGSMDAKKISP